MVVVRGGCVVVVARGGGAWWCVVVVVRRGGASWWCVVVVRRGGAWWCVVVVVRGGGGAWWVVVRGAWWCVEVRGAWRCAVVRVGAWWCVEVRGGAWRWWCVVVRGGGAWWCVSNVVEHESSFHEFENDARQVEKVVTHAHSVGGALWRHQYHVAKHRFHMAKQFHSVQHDMRTEPRCTCAIELPHLEEAFEKRSSDRNHLLSHSIDTTTRPFRAVRALLGPCTTEVDVAAALKSCVSKLELELVQF